MRKFRRRGTRSRSNRRKVYWTGSNFVGQAQDLTIGDVASAWAKWPSGLFDPKILNPQGSTQITPNDETWTRAVVQSTTQVPVQGALPQTLPMEVVVGLIAWDAANQADAESLELAITNIGDAGSAPSPTLRGDLDWIIRIPFCYIADNLFSFAADATFLNSRAMRKLPPGTGVLWCIAALQPLDLEASTRINWSLDVRALIKAGYYQP